MDAREVVPLIFAALSFGIVLGVYWEGRTADRIIGSLLQAFAELRKHLPDPLDEIEPYEENPADWWKDG